MSADWQFRDEFKVKSEFEKSFIGFVGIDPIDAPSTIAAGYHISWKYLPNEDKYLVLPACVMR
jgi:hypothetical protein